MAKTKTNDVLPMNDKMKTVREALEEAIAIDKRDNGSDPSMYTHQLEDALATLKSMEGVTYARQGSPIQMQDVLLACGELNERERVAVQWVLDKVNALPQAEAGACVEGLATSVCYPPCS